MIPQGRSPEDAVIIAALFQDRYDEADEVAQAFGDDGKAENESVRRALLGPTDQLIRDSVGGAYEAGARSGDFQSRLPKREASLACARLDAVGRRAKAVAADVGPRVTWSSVDIRRAKG